MDASTGEIRAFAGNYAPSGWMLCNGQSVSLNDFQALYALIGTTYGGSGQNFNLPDLRGRLIVNQGQGPARTNRIIGTSGGEEGVSLTDAQIPPHNHNVQVANNPATTNVATNNYLAAATGTLAPTLALYMPGTVPVAGQPAPTITQLYPTTVQSAQIGANEQHENRMPYICINYIICMNGIYPSFN